MKSRLQQAIVAPELPSRRKNRPLVLIMAARTERTADLAWIMRLEGCDFRHAATRKEALRLCGEEPFALVFIDMDSLASVGFGILASLRKDPRRAIPVVMAESTHCSDHVVRGLSLGAADYLADDRYSQAEIGRTLSGLLRPRRQ
jgi:PleD family two-component response regulator